MRYIIILALCVVLQANDELFKMLSDYRKNGLEGIRIALERQLLDKKYWDFVIAQKDTRFGYYESVKYLFVASKTRANLQLYEIGDNSLRQINSTSAIFGENKLDKFAEGDLATPIGVYNLTQKLQNLNQYYGPLAFATSYPNLLDRLSKKTGSGIWIHGLPLNGNRSEINTRGCIAIENDILRAYEKAIDYKQTLLITSSDTLKEVPKASLSTILHALFVWRDAWINNDLDLYLSFYDENFMRFDGMKIGAFRAFKKQVFDREERKTIAFNDINIAPYPNSENVEMFRITFLEDYRASSGYAFKGTKELYVAIKGGKMSILVEK